jgi:hypothetical protein
MPAARHSEWTTAQDTNGTSGQRRRLRIQSLRVSPSLRDQMKGSGLSQFATHEPTERPAQVQSRRSRAKHVASRLETIANMAFYVMAHHSGPELGGTSESLDIPQPADQWVPTVENLGHQIPSGHCAASGRTRDTSWSRNALDNINTAKCPPPLDRDECLRWRPDGIDE